MPGKGEQKYIPLTVSLLKVGCISWLYLLKERRGILSHFFLLQDLHINTAFFLVNGYPLDNGYQ